jgi:D-lactate dehydrogenase (cytochrome)
MQAKDIQTLQAIIGDLERVSTKKADLEAHSVDESFHEGHEPEVVIWPESAAEISEIVKFANQCHIPVTLRSGGSSLEGNPIPVQGGIVLAMSRMDHVLEIRPEDLQVRVQPGVVYDQLNQRLGKYGLFFPPAPGSADVATIGGMVANSSSGLHAVKYGGTKDYVLKLEVVLPTGEIITMGSNAAKSASGYDLVRLFTGSEGTLGVVTEIILRLRGLMEKTAGIAVFDSVKEVAHTVFEMVRYGLTPAALELMDTEIVRAVNRWKGLTLEEASTLVMEFHGTPAGVREEVEYARGICMDHNCRQFDMGISTEERDRIWQGRKEAHNAVKYLNTDCTVTIGDIVVPISRYPEAVEKAYEAGRKYNIRVATFGHAGDGNLHTEILAQKGDEDAKRRAELVNEEIVRWAISVGGTATGEHGVGIGKRKFMALEHGASLEVMKQIKRLLDPNGILNPGKIFEEL